MYWCHGKVHDKAFASAVTTSKHVCIVLQLFFESYLNKEKSKSEILQSWCLVTNIWNLSKHIREALPKNDAEFYERYRYQFLPEICCFRENLNSSKVNSIRSRLKFLQLEGSKHKRMIKESFSWRFRVFQLSS